VTERLAALAVDGDVDAAEFRGVLQVADVEAVAEQPSVWPNAAPTTSLRSTTPSATRSAWIRYFAVSSIAVVLEHDYVSAWEIAVVTGTTCPPPAARPRCWPGEGVESSSERPGVM